MNALKTLRGDSHAYSIVALPKRLESLASAIDILRAQETSQDRRASTVLHLEEETRLMVDIAQKLELHDVERRAKSVLLLLHNQLDALGATDLGETDAFERALRRLAVSVEAASAKAGIDPSRGFAIAQEHFVTSLPKRLESMAAALDMAQTSHLATRRGQAKEDLATLAQSIAAAAEALDLGIVARRARSMLIFLGNMPTRQHVLEIEKLHILSRSFNRLIQAIEIETGNAYRYDQ